MAEAMQVGRTTNLLEGIGHFWHSPSGVLRFADETPVATGNAQRTDVDGSWSPAQVSIHDSANALVDALFDLRIDSLAGEPQLTNIALHRLLAAKPGTWDKLATHLGVPLEAGLRYLLVTTRRVRSCTNHDVFSVPQGRGPPAAG